MAEAFQNSAEGRAAAKELAQPPERTKQGGQRLPRSGRRLGTPQLARVLDMFRGRVPGQREARRCFYPHPHFNGMSHVAAECQLDRAYSNVVKMLWLPLQSLAHAGYVSAAQVCSRLVGDTYPDLWFLQGMML